MKNKLTFISGLLMLFIGNYTIAQDLSLEWAISVGGTETDYGWSIAVDASGNCYITGIFRETADFDPGAEILNLSSAGSEDIFVLKLNVSGDLVWAKQMGGTGSEWGTSIVVDTMGNVYTTGYFRETADFDPGAGTFNLSSAGSDDIFIQKLNTWGDLVWARQMGGIANDQGKSITLDALGNVYSTGHFIGTVDFDPGAGTLNLTSAGSSDIFIQKLDSSGNLIWVKQIGGTEGASGEVIALDAMGNVYTTGKFSGTIDFDPGADTLILTSAGSSDIFFQKLDASGDLVWAKHLGGTSLAVSESMAVDASGNVYTTGNFFGTLDFDPGVGTFNLSSAGTSDIFIQKLDASGELVWAKRIGGTGYDIGRSINVDAMGDVYTTGQFGGTADFDPGTAILNLTADGTTDIFIQKLDASGDFLWVKQMGGAQWDQGRSLVVDAIGNVYTTGAFTWNADFDPGPESFPLFSAGGGDIFVLKLSIPPVGINELEGNLGINVYPNPTSGFLEIDKGNNMEINIRVSDNVGKMIISKTSNDQITSLDINYLSSGFYYITISNGENTTTQKIVKL